MAVDMVVREGQAAIMVSVFRVEFHMEMQKCHVNLAVEAETIVLEVPRLVGVL